MLVAVQRKEESVPRNAGTKVPVLAACEHRQSVVGEDSRFLFLFVVVVPPRLRMPFSTHNTKPPTTTGYRLAGIAGAELATLL